MSNLGPYELGTSYMEGSVGVSRSAFYHSIVGAVESAKAFVAKHIDDEDMEASAWVGYKGTRIWTAERGFTVIEAKALYAHLLAMENAKVRVSALVEQLDVTLEAANSQRVAA